ncbi:MAG TPA: hypothetical protein VHO70_12965, partial [Chitinispirillaceae bacterium]|nr:hypothetical protein [Chitinispirillaceae bacterium]
RLVEMNGKSILLFSRDTRTSACRLVICTASGKSVFQKDLTSENNISDLSFLPAGMYIADLRGTRIHGNEKIVIGR